MNTVHFAVEQSPLGMNDSPVFNNNKKACMAELRVQQLEEQEETEARAAAQSEAAAAQVGAMCKACCTEAPNTTGKGAHARNSLAVVTFLSSLEVQSFLTTGVFSSNDSQKAVCPALNSPLRRVIERKGLLWHNHFST